MRARLSHILLSVHVPIILFKWFLTYVVPMDDVHADLEQGTCIRIFNANDGKLVRELRRGIDPSLIRCMSFYRDSSRKSCFLGTCGGI